MCDYRISYPRKHDDLDNFSAFSCFLRLETAEVLVDVTYQCSVAQKAANERPFFQPELQQQLQLNQINMVHLEPLLTTRQSRGVVVLIIYRTI